MTDKTNSRDEAEAKLWAEIKHGRIGMLALADEPRRFQPMSAIAEPDERIIWFFTRLDTDLARAVTGADEAIFIVQSKDGDLQACLVGELDLLRDEGRIDRYWNPMIAAWFPDGKDDPKLALLRFTISGAEVWRTTTGLIGTAWEVVKANTTRRLPEVGEQVTLDLEDDSAV
jgi:general stress protein 26